MNCDYRFPGGKTGMSVPDKQHLLIVQSVNADHGGLPTLLRRLAGQSVVDPFTARQRLIGRGPNLLARGPKEKLAPLASLVADHGLTCWLIPEMRLRPAPVRLRGLKSDTAGLTLFTSGEEVRLQRGDRVMAVLGDLSGSVAGKQLRRQMAGKIYHGTETAPPLDDDELYRAILRGRPVLDLYLFDAKGQVRTAIRVQPGRFDPKGLGDAMKLSATGNLEQILNLVRDYAGTFTLSLDFGLVNLPGSTLHKGDDDPRLQRDNLQSLTRFGFLLADMAGAGVFPSRAATVPSPGLADSPEDLQYVSGLLDEIRGEAPDLPTDTPEAAPSLPPPPARSRTGNRGLAGIWSLLGGSAGLGFYLLGENHALWNLVYRYGIRPGIVPALIAGACLWSGFHFLRLKRRVENTPTSRIRSVAMGLVEVQGRSRRKFALVSPMTHLPCVYYRLRRYRRDRRDNWRLTSSKDSTHVPFYLEDDSGALTVDPGRASVRTGHKQTGYGGPNDLFFSTTSGLDGDEKWVEEVIPEGTGLYVLGEADENRPARLPLREQLTLALRALKKDPEALKHYDENRDGAISAEEWNRARREVEERLLHQNLGDRGPDLPLRDRVVIRRPRQRSLPFIVAETASEANLVRGYGLYTIPLFGGALLAAVWSLVMLADFLQ
jgi:hypothetical protein